MQNGRKIERDLVLLGGGHAHVQVIKRFAMRPEPGVRVTLISPDPHTPYSGMLPGLIAGHYSFDETHIDLNRLCRFASARFIRSAATGLDLPARKALLMGRPAIGYDLLSIDTGSTPHADDTPGAAEFATPVKPISQFLSHWERVKTRALAQSGVFTVAVVGAGAGGVELLLSIQHALETQRQAAGLFAPCRFSLFSRGEVVPNESAALRKRVRDSLATRGVELHERTAIARVERQRLITEDGAQFEADEIFWVTAAGAPHWLKDSGLATDAEGFIAVDAHLRSRSHPDIFAAGDVASMVEDPRPKAGVFAVRQGLPLSNNLRAALRGQTLETYRPQRRFLKILATGPRHAIAARGDWALGGDWVWRWKDSIDRRFMAKFNQLPDLPMQAGILARLKQAWASPQPKDIRCAGCGAKIDSKTLSNGLEALPSQSRPDILVGLDAPDDAAVIAPARDNRVSVQTVDAFRAMVDDPWLFGRIAANHALGDLYAMGAQPQTAMAIVTLPAHGQTIIARDLQQMMAGAVDVLNAAGAMLVGGHTAEGVEPTLGFALTGLADPARITHKSGMRAGDALVLTKPLGVGALLAADMRGKALGRDIDGAIASMTQSSADAARILAEHGATACTDVTGFGLAGHLNEMLRASAVGGALRLEAVPVLPGAREAMRAGITSSLHPDNAKAATEGQSEPWRADASILFDPQTAGGLLASIPEANAPACIAALRHAGYAQAAIIGRAIATDGNGAMLRVE